MGRSDHRPDLANATGEEVWRPQLNRLRGAYADHTIAMAVRSFRFFQFWCTRHGVCALPADDETVAAFVDYYSQVYTPRTLSGHLLGVRHVHLAMGLPSPIEGDALRIARLRHLRATRRPRRIDVTTALRDRLLAACAPGLIGLRDQALIHLAYDTLCRRSELVLFRVEDLRTLPDGAAALGLRRLRDGPDIVHDVAFLSTLGLAAVRTWIEAAGLTSGPILREFRCRRVGAGGISPQAVHYRLQTLAARAEIPRDADQRLTSHGLRVGAAQTLAASGRTLIQIMRAGRWRSLDIPAGYLREAHVNVWAQPDGDTYPVTAGVQRWRKAPHRK